LISLAARFFLDEQRAVFAVIVTSPALCLAVRRTNRPEGDPEIAKFIAIDRSPEVKTTSPRNGKFFVTVW
jgi:hypothetical protein